MTLELYRASVCPSHHLKNQKIHLSQDIVIGFVNTESSSGL